VINITNDVSISQIISACLLMVAVGGIMVTYRQMRNNYKMQKATFFKELYSTMFADSEVRSALYMVEYNRFVYSEQFHGSNDENIVDRLLSFADLVCDLYAQSVLTDHEMDFFKYEFYRIYKNVNVQRYLDFLKGRYTDTGHAIEPFPAFVAYCETELRRRGQSGIRLLGNLRFNLKAVAALGRRRP
jgi:hypothetical protein